MIKCVYLTNNNQAYIVMIICVYLTNNSQTYIVMIICAYLTNNSQVYIVMIICVYLTNNSQAYRVSKKSVICGAWCKIVPFLCNYPVWCFFFHYFLKICNFVLYSNGPKENLRIFFSQNQKFIKAKMCIHIIPL